MKPILDHTALQFKKNELATLEYIYSRGFFASTFEELNRAISSAYSQYNVREYKSGRKSFDFNFVSDFDIEIERHSHRIIVHAEVTGDYEFTSYSLGISHKDDAEKLIRRFHFDYDHENIRKNQKAFISHLQYGGISGNGFSGAIFNSTDLEPKLSVPRLNFPPINLALLLDIVFCEFQNETTKKITENPEWRALIRNNEVFILQKYYKTISAHINSHRHSKDALVRDICYA